MLWKKESQYEVSIHGILHVLLHIQAHHGVMMRYFRESKGKRTTLTLVGAGHLYELNLRFIESGFRRIKITDKSKYFANSKNLDLFVLKNLNEID